MSIEAIRIASSWFADSTNGADAVLATLALDGVDARPAPFAAIVDELNDGDVARDGFPAAGVLGVSIDPIRDLDGIVQVLTGEGDVQLRFRMPVDNAQTELARVEAHYRVAAVKRSFRRLMRDDHAVARTRNGIYLETCSNIITSVENVARQQGNPFVVGYVIPTVRLRELDPYG